MLWEKHSDVMLALKMEGGHEPKNVAPSRGWTGQENSFSPRNLKGTEPC